MTDRKIQQIWQNSYEAFLSSGYFLSDAQKKASYAILNCKTGSFGMNISLCPDCGHMEFRNNSCRNRNCPSCQAVNKELWVDRRRAEVIDSPYFHVVFTLPHELNSLIYCNQKLLYGFFHKCCAETLLELTADKKHLGATPGIIQVLHTWDQEINYHVHMDCSHSFKTDSCIFQLPVKNCAILMNGLNSGIPFIKRIGALMSKKLSMALAMPLNIWAGILIRSPYRIAVSCQ